MHKSFFHKGFTLIEIAIVLVIVGLLFGSILGPLSEQSKSRRIKATQEQLRDINEALIGYAAINGYLPCPASLTSNGQQVRQGGNPNGDCSSQHGYIPNADLGLSGHYDATSGLLVDSWSSPIRYSLSDVNSWVFAKNILTDSGPGDFLVCSDTSACSSANAVAAGLVSVVFSLGEDKAIPASTPNQAENIDGNDINFIYKPPYADESFDDLLMWISPNTLILHLVKSGQIGG